MTDNQNIRSKVIQGGTYLILRRAIGFVISFGGMIILMRLIGAKNYGVYTSIVGIVAYMTEVCSMGLSSYLVRLEGDIDKKLYHLAFTFVLLTTGAALIIGIGISFPLQYWLHTSDIQLPFVITLLSMPSTAILLPALAMMERDLNYRHIAYFELCTQVIYYSVAITLAFLGFGIWAPVIGNLCQGLVALLVCFVMTRYIPSFYWSWVRIKQMLKYCVNNLISKRVWGLKVLVSPLLVGRFIGPEAVAVVSLTTRLIEALSFVNGAILRISFSVMSKIQNDKQRTENAMNEGMLLQILSLAPLLIGFALLSKWFIPFFLDDNWLPVLDMFPYLALAAIIFAVFSFHVNVLYVRGSNWQVIQFNMIHVALFSATTFMLVPRIGLLGYALAEIVAIIAYTVLYRSIQPLYSLNYQRPVFYAIACIPALFIPLFDSAWSYLLVLPLLYFVILSKPRSYLINTIKQLLSKNKQISSIEQ
jgi:O-antigen/teichoic acid export membrane protein